MALRHVRHRNIARIRKNSRLLAFLTAKATELAATGAARTIASKVTFASGTLTFGANAGNGKLVTIGSRVYTFKTALSETDEVLATGTLTASTNFVENDTVTVTAGSTKVYIFKDAPDASGLQVDVGTDLATSLVNLSTAINTMDNGVQTTYDATHIYAEADIGTGASANVYGTVKGVGNTSDGAWAATTLLGGVTYVAPVVNEVLISAVNASGSLDNLIAAINGAAGEATTYSTGTVENTEVTVAVGSGDTMVATAIEIGDPGNSIITTTDVTSASWGSVTLVGGYSISKYATSRLTYGANAVAADELTIGARTYTIVTALTEVTGVAATGTLTATQNFVANDTVTIRAIVYTFKSLANTSGLQVTIGHSLERSLFDLAAAVNFQNNGVTATADGTKLYVTASAVGTAANSYATTDVSTYASWGNATLSGGVATVTPVVDEIKVAASAARTLDNVAAAINGSAGEGTVYSTGTAVNAQVTAAPTYATGTAAFSTAGTANDTLTVGGVVYTIKAAYAATANLVVVGATATATRDNFIAAINAADGSGTMYGSSTVINPQVTATATIVGGAPAILFTAKVTGTTGNAYTLAKSSTAITVTGAGTLTGATDTLTLTAKTIGAPGNLIATVTDTASATFTSTNMVLGFTANQLTCTAHSLLNGAGPFILTTTGTLPSGLQLLTPYWIHKAESVSSLSISTSRDNIDEAQVLTTGTGTHTMTRMADAFSVLEALKKHGEEVVSAATDIDNL